MLHMFIVWIPKDVKLITIVPHTCGTAALVTLVSSAWRSSNGLLESLDYESFDTCKPCLMGKMTKTPFSGTVERATNLLEIIHTDVCGPMSVVARGGYRYILTLKDDLSRYGYVYLMKHKSETFEKFKEISEWGRESTWPKDKVPMIRSWRRIFKSQIWYTLKKIWNRFTTHAAWNTSA